MLNSLNNVRSIQASDLDTSIANNELSERFLCETIAEDSS